MHKYNLCSTVTVSYYNHANSANAHPAFLDDAHFLSPGHLGMVTWVYLLVLLPSHHHHGRDQIFFLLSFHFELL